MKDFWIEYTKERQNSPLTYWVHVSKDEVPYTNAKNFEPPRAPKKQMGFANYWIEYNKLTLHFTSINELEHFIDVMNTKVLPSTLSLSKNFQAGPNTHWLSRLPKHATPWKFRQGLVKYLHELKSKFV